jgi:hypothetical protein
MPAEKSDSGEDEDGAVAPPLFGAAKLLVNSWPAISERPQLLSNQSKSQLSHERVAARARRCKNAREGVIREKTWPDMGANSIGWFRAY